MNEAIEMNDIWKTIHEDYETSKFSLWCPKHSGHWNRDDNKGYYHLWKAYYAALNTEVKEPLLYARILMMMGDEQDHKQSDHTRLHRYYLPAKKQYQLAIEAGSQPTEKELAKCNFSVDTLSYRFECEDKPYDEQISYIEGHEVLSDFDFHDSKVVFFSHDEKSSVMKLKYSKVLELHFEEVDDIEIQTDPVCDWIGDFYCYPAFWNKNKLVFDIGFYKILCKKIVVASYE